MKIYSYDYQLEDGDTGGVGNSDDRTLKDFRKLPYPRNAYEFIYQYHPGRLYCDGVVWDDDDRKATLEKLADFIYDWTIPYSEELLNPIIPEKIRKDIEFFIDVFRSTRPFIYLCQKHLGCGRTAGLSKLNSIARRLRSVFRTDKLLTYGLSGYTTMMTDILTKANIPLVDFTGKKSGILMPVNESKLNEVSEHYELVYVDTGEDIEQDLTCIPIKYIKHGEKLHAKLLPDGITGYRLNTQIRVISVLELLSIRPDNVRSIGLLSPEEMHEMLSDLNDILQIDVSFADNKSVAWTFHGREIIPYRYEPEVPADEHSERVRELGKILISELNLTPRPANALDRCGVKTIADIIAMKPNSVAHIRGIGTGSYVNICSALKKFKIVPSDDGEVWIDEMLL